MIKNSLLGFSIDGNLSYSSMYCFVHSCIRCSTSLLYMSQSSVHQRSCVEQISCLCQSYLSCEETVNKQCIRQRTCSTGKHSETENQEQIDGSLGHGHENMAPSHVCLYFIKVWGYHLFQFCALNSCHLSNSPPQRMVKSLIRLMPSLFAFF